ncbi:hypothetical protein FACS1894216_14570 [Synergistales bacterium]|nr:hypothetical protein FACS1894216_14570 [Synergistales bacterium]
MARCPGCMTDNVTDFPCKHCGWSERDRESALHLVPGTVLKGRYYIGRAIGQGGFGITYLGYDNVLNVKIAVKEYFPLSLVTRSTDTMQLSFAGTDAASDFEYGLEKFLEEARILASFSSSPNVVATKDFFKENGLAYMVMEYLDGLDLKRYLDKQGGAMPWDQAQNIIMHVIDALKDVHSEGLLHRDISPDNIFITSKGLVKILDFGAARFAFGMQNKSLSVVLKPGYAPVEQYRTKGNQGPWTDVYSLGATLYKCVTGVLPPESLGRMESDELKSPRELGIEVSGDFDRSVMKALSVKAKDRFQSVQDFQSSLLGRPLASKSEQKPAMQPMNGTTVRIHESQPQYAQSKSPAAKEGTPLIAVCVIVLLCAAGALGWFMIKKDTPVGGEGVSVASNQNTAARNTEPKENPPVLELEPEPEPAKPDAGEIFKEAKSYRQRGDHKRAIELYEEAAALGHADAMSDLGFMYESGEGVRKDFNAAVQWYEKAAVSGSDPAKLQLARIYYYGVNGVAKDHKKAAELLLSLPDKGGRPGQAMLENIGKTPK